MNARRLPPWSPAATLVATLCIIVPLVASVPSSAAELKFDRVVIDNDFPAAYQVEVADVNGDGKPDIVAVGGDTCAWYQNPTWKKRVVTGPKQTPGIISSATRDIDGDGKAEIAIGYDFEMNEPWRGKLLLARQGKTLDAPWTVEPVADVPSVHRLRWGIFYDLDRSRVGLVVAPIFGPSARPPLFNQEAARPRLFFVDVRSRLVPAKGPAFGTAPVLHAIDVSNGEGASRLLGASNRGVTSFNGMIVIAGSPAYVPINLVAGAPGNAPKKGASEIHVGHLKDGREFLATVEPWHGTDVAVYLAEKPEPSRFIPRTAEALGPRPGDHLEKPEPSRFIPRTVLDTSLKEGHALWVADVDGDGDDEVFAGYRGPGTSVLMYDFNGKTWDRTVVDDHIAAQDLRGGDLDGDGIPDVVAVGGSTHNVIWYRPTRRVR